MKRFDSFAPIVLAKILLGCCVVVLISLGIWGQEALVGPLHGWITSILGWPSPVLVIALMIVSALVGWAIDWILTGTYTPHAADLAGRAPGGAPPDDSQSLSKRKGDPGHGPLIGAISVIYAVLLAFVVIVAWQRYDQAEEVAMQEQNDVRSLFSVLNAYPDAVAARDHDYARLNEADFDIIGYARQVVLEWGEMNRGKPVCLNTQFDVYHVSASTSDVACGLDVSEVASESTTFGALLRNEPQSIWPTGNPAVHTWSSYALDNWYESCIAEDVYRLRPKGERQQDLYQEAVTLMTAFENDREHRRNYYEEHLRPILWFALIVGALITVGVTYLSRQTSIRSNGLTLGDDRHDAGGELGLRSSIYRPRRDELSPLGRDTRRVHRRKRLRRRDER
jgi:hypothetical protein